MLEYRFSISSPSFTRTNCCHRIETRVEISKKFGPDKTRFDQVIGLPCPCTRPRIDRRYRGRVFDLVASGEGPWITYSLVSALGVGDLGEEGEGPPLENDRPLPKQGRKGLSCRKSFFFFVEWTCPLDFLRFLKWYGNILNSLFVVFNVIECIFFSFWRCGNYRKKIDIVEFVDLNK